MWIYGDKEIEFSKTLERINGTIFVSIPSYRDPECQNTIIDLYEKAKYPNRVISGILWQISKEEDKNCFQKNYKKYEKNIKEIFIDYKSAKGPVFARSIIGKKYSKNGNNVF